MIKFNQNGTTDDFGKAVEGVEGVQVDCTSDVSGSVYSWTLEDVPHNPDDPNYHSALVPGTVISTSATASFVPDARGEFQIGLVVDSNPKVTNCFAVPDADGLIDPSFGANPANTKYGTNTRGWNYHLTKLFNKVRAGVAVPLELEVTDDLDDAWPLVLRHKRETGAGAEGIAVGARLEVEDDEGTSVLAGAWRAVVYDFQGAGGSDAYSTAIELGPVDDGTPAWVLRCTPEGVGIGLGSTEPSARLHVRTGPAAAASQAVAIFDKDADEAADNILLELRRQGATALTIEQSSSGGVQLRAPTGKAWTILIGSSAKMSMDTQKITACDDLWPFQTTTFDLGSTVAVWKDLYVANLKRGGTQISLGASGELGFFGSTPIARPTITGATDSQKVTSIINALSSLGLAADGT